MTPLAAALSLAALTTTTSATTLPEGRYRLEVVARARASVAFVGASTTHTVSLVDVDAAGDAVQRVCSIETRGRGYVARPLPTALRDVPAQRYHVDVDGDRVRADPGPLHLGKAHPLTMEVIVKGVGRFVVDVESVGHAVLDGHLVDGGAAGRVVVKQNRQRIQRGLPFAVDGDTVVDDAAFTLVRAVDQRQGCP